jgi:hypothetical protein
MGRMIADALQKIDPSNLKRRVDVITIKAENISQRELNLPSFPQTSPLTKSQEAARIALEKQLIGALAHAVRYLGGHPGEFISTETEQGGVPIEVTVPISYN